MSGDVPINATSGSAIEHPIADLNDSLLGWTLQSELQLNQHFTNAQLFIDAPITADELERIDRFYGTFLSRQLAAGADLGILLDNTPNLAATTLVARAARMVNPDSFFSEYLGGLDLDANPEWIAAVKDKAATVLAQAGLWVPDSDAPGCQLTHQGITGGNAYIK